MTPKMSYFAFTKPKFTSAPATDITDIHGTPSLIRFRH